MARIPWALSFVFLALGSSPATAQDEVELKNGRTLSGLVREYPDRVEVTQELGTITLSHSQVRIVRRGGSVHDDFLRKRASVGRDPQAHLDLAEWCRTVGLGEEAERLDQAALALLEQQASLPTHEVILPWTRPEVPEGWQSSSSEHFHLHHPPEFAEAKAALEDLEGVYVEFTRTYQPRSGELEGRNPLEIFAYVDPAQFRKVSWGTHAGFAEMRHGWAVVLRQSVSADTLSLLRHEAAHLLFGALLEDQTSWRRAIRRYHGVDYEPANPLGLTWFDEGFACDWAHWEALPLLPGETSGTGSRRLLAVMLDSGQGAALEQLMNMDWNEFHGFGETLHYAQSWAFVRFLREAEDGKYREGWFRFLEQARHGRGGVLVFRACFGLRPAALEPAWRNWAKDFAGQSPPSHRVVIPRPPNRSGWESGCHFDLLLDEPDPLRAHSQIDELARVAESGSPCERTDAVWKLVGSFPSCRRTRMIELFKNEPDCAVAGLYVDYLIWARATEACERLRHWRDQLREHAQDPCSEGRGEGPREQWLKFAGACDALGDHGETAGLLKELRRDYAATRPQGLLVTRLTDPRVIPFLGELLEATYSGRMTNNSVGWASHAVRVLTSKEGNQPDVMGRERPSAEACIRWIRENGPYLEWVDEPEVRASRDGFFRLGYWRVNETAKAEGTRAPVANETPDPAGGGE